MQSVSWLMSARFLVPEAFFGLIRTTMIHSPKILIVPVLGMTVVVPVEQFLPCSQHDAVSQYRGKDSGVTQFEHVGMSVHCGPQQGNAFMFTN